MLRFRKGLLMKKLICMLLVCMVLSNSLSALATVKQDITKDKELAYTPIEDKEANANRNILWVQCYKFCPDRFIEYANDCFGEMTPVIAEDLGVSEKEADQTVQYLHLEYVGIKDNVVYYANEDNSFQAAAVFYNGNASINEKADEIGFSISGDNRNQFAGIMVDIVTSFYCSELTDNSKSSNDFFYWLQDDRMSGDKLEVQAFYLESIIEEDRYQNSIVRAVGL